MATTGPVKAATGNRSAIAQRFRPTPCGIWSPHEAGMFRQGKWEKPVPVQCNRPAGHDGNHMCLAGSFERLAEWGQCEVIK